MGMIYAHSDVRQVISFRTSATAEGDTAEEKGDSAELRFGLGTYQLVASALTKALGPTTELALTHQNITSF